ncbi:MAG: hypothetical protein FWH17_04075 [Oscillospiraceae bacterium]|nr:hypothetical protein [Oscillospiraceae bacterium]
MKKIQLRTAWLLIIIYALFAAFALTACAADDAQGGADSFDGQSPNHGGQNGAAIDDGSAGNTPASGNDPQIADTPIAYTGFALKIDDFLVFMDMNIDAVIGALGEPHGFFVAPSCAFDGDDRIYLYYNVQIHTYPLGDENFIHTIMFIDDSILFSTTEGIKMSSSSLQDVVDVYGNDYAQDGDLYTYTTSQTTLQFRIENDIVIGITYGLIFET